MSLARAFTTRRFKSSVDLRNGTDDLKRSNTTTKTPASIRSKISSPVELIHTTNMLTYNAPDIVRKSPLSTSTTSARSDDESDHSTPTAESTPPTSPDTPFPSKRSAEIEPNHLSCYFTPPGQAVPPVKAEAPAIPQRSPSHTKKSYDILSRKRSVSRISEQSTRTVSSKASYTFSRSSSTSTTASSVSRGSNPPISHMAKISTAAISTPIPQIQEPAASPAPTQPLPTPPAMTTLPPVSLSTQKKEMPRSQQQQNHHPFGHELAQVSELAEEFGPVSRRKQQIGDEEDQELARRGLCKFSAEDYLGEIQGLFSSIFGAETKPVAAAAAGWI